MKREPIDEIFSAALSRFVSGHGAKTELAKKVNVTPQYISAIALGRRGGDESLKRAIAMELGYEYEEFLDIGREILGISKKKGIASQQVQRLPFQDELDQFGEYSYDRIFVICHHVGREMGWQGFINAIKGGPGEATLPGQAEYLRKEIDDYELYTKVREYAEWLKTLL